MQSWYIDNWFRTDVDHIPDVDPGPVVSTSHSLQIFLDTSG